MGREPLDLRDGRLEPRNELGVKSQLELGVDKVGAGGGVVEALSASLRNSDTRCVVFIHVAWKKLRAQALVACQRRSARAALAKGEASEGQAP
jgi:isopropylmalate/homocitrate/citramalate synthase